jgi:hypothetical protein
VPPVIDYVREDFTKNGETYDVIFDAVGEHSFRRSRDSLKPGGMYVPTGGRENLIYLLWTRRIGDKRVVFQIPRPARKDVVFLKALIEPGSTRRSSIGAIRWPRWSRPRRQKSLRHPRERRRLPPPMTTPASSAVASLLGIRRRDMRPQACFAL